MALLGTIPALRNELRQRLGYINDTILLPNPVDPSAISRGESPLDVALSDALREINRHWQLASVGSFNTVADQQVYTPLPGGAARRLLKVYWSDDACSLAAYWPSLADELDIPLSQVIEGEGGLRLPAQPSTLHILRRQEAELRRRFAREGVITSPTTVYLTPAPTSVQAVYFIYAQPRFADVDEITDDDMTIASAFWAFAQYRGHEILATGAGAVSEVRGPDGTVTKISVDQHRQAAERNKREFVSYLPLMSEWWLR